MKKILVVTCLAATCIAWEVSASPTLQPSAINNGGFDACNRTAQRERKAKRLEALSDLFRQLGLCINISSNSERAQCVQEAYVELFVERAEIEDQYDARLDLCTRLGGGRYEPQIDPLNFSSIITNPYLPMPVGKEWIYEKTADGEVESIVVTVLDETREIQGVECRVVRDTVTVDGELVEDTFDYFAQDAFGNVWYFGEISQEYEDGYLASLDGSWIAGVEGALAGIIMPATPCPGDVYRQEFALGEAEDAAAVEALDASVTVPAGIFSGCLETSEFTPLEPGFLEFKFYAIDVGLVLEVDPESGDRLELLSCTP